MCYQRPTTKIPDANEKEQPIECEILIYQQVAPLSYQVFKVLYKEEMMKEEDGEEVEEN